MANETGAQELFINNNGSLCGLPSGDFILTEDLGALRAHFQRERDEQLGRWRSPEHPNFVVYPIKDDDAVWVLDEAETGAIRASAPATRINARATDNPYDLVADAYFAARPEPKPWVDAQLGELWELTIDAQEHRAFVRKANGELLFATDTRGNWDPKVSRITAGHRIYPLAEES